MNAKPFDDQKTAQAKLDTFLSAQLKPHHQSYEVSDNLPDGAVQTYAL